MRALAERWLPAGGAAVADAHAELDAWFAPTDPATRVVEVVVRGDRIRWRAGFAAIVGADGRRDGELATVRAFDALEAELTELEARLGDWWRQGAADRDLTHEIAPAALRRRPGVNAITAAIARARMRIFELDDAFAAPGSSNDSLQRLMHELAAGCDVPHRLARLEERYEFLAELYEAANDRLAELAYFRRERALELAILVVLAIETALLLAGLR